MRLAAALVTGTATAMLVGLVTGAFSFRWFRRRPRSQVGQRQEWLAQAGLDLTPRQFWMVSGGVAAVTFLVLYLLTGLWPVAFAPAAVLALLPRTYFARVRARRLAEIRKAWPDGLRDLTASISAGMSLPRALEALARSGPEPLQRAFRRFPVLARTIGAVPALNSLKEELADPTSDRVLEVLILAHERGGAIVPEILGDLAAATTKDVWALDELESEMLEQKINARVVFVLPWVVLVAITLRPGPFRDFYASSAGVLVVAIGAVLSFIGIGVAGRLGREPDEPRVLGGAARAGVRP